MRGFAAIIVVVGALVTWDWHAHHLRYSEQAVAMLSQIGRAFRN